MIYGLPKSGKVESRTRFSVALHALTYSALIVRGEKFSLSGSYRAGSYYILLSAGEIATSCCHAVVRSSHEISIPILTCCTSLLLIRIGPSCIYYALDFIGKIDNLSRRSIFCYLVTTSPKSKTHTYYLCQFGFSRFHITCIGMDS